MTTVDRRGVVLDATSPSLLGAPNPDRAIKTAVRVATTGSNITLAGLLTIDGVTLAAGDRVLVKDQTDQTTNGIYIADAGTWSRSSDFEFDDQVADGLRVGVTTGTLNALTFWQLVGADPIVLGTSTITFTSALGRIAGPLIVIGPLTVAGPVSVSGTLSVSGALSAGPLTIAMPANSTSQGLVINGTGSQTGTVTTDFFYNKITITNDQLNVASPGLFTFGGYLELDTGGPNAKGSKIGFTAAVINNTAGSNTLGDFVALAGRAFANQPNGGTNTGAGAAGTLYGISSLAWAQSGATNYFVVSGGEIDVEIDAGASAKHRWGWSIVGAGANRGATTDAAFEVGAVASGASFNFGLFLDNIHGAPPLATTATVIGTDGSANTIANGIDLSAYTITGNFLKGPGGFSVTGGGHIIGSFLEIDGTTNNGITVNDGTGTATAVFNVNNLFAHSVITGSLNSYNFGFITNNTLAGYFDTSQKFHLGTAGISQGALGIHGLTSGVVTVAVAAAAGTWTMQLPATGGTSGYFLQTDGTGVTTWAAASGSGSGTVNAGTAGQMAYYASSTAAVSGNASANISSGALTLGQAGSVVGSVAFANATSGSVTLQPPTGALGSSVLTVPATTDTLMGKATTDVMTNKTLDTAGSGNVFKINGTTINAVTGTGSTVALAAGPTFTGTLAASVGSFSSTLASAAHAITSASVSALAVGLNGSTNPAFVVDASTASQAAGLKVTGAATGGTVAVAAIDSGTNTSLTINAKGSGTIGIGSVSTGAVTITPALTLSAALTYGGVTLSNAVTGTGNMVLSASPTLTGTLSAAAGSFSSTLASTAHTITSAAAGALTVGLGGATNPALQVDASTASSATGIKIKSAAAAAGVAVSVITSGTNENLTIDAAGSGTITLGGTSTGTIIHTRATTLSAALTYGGVTLANAVTGTGNMVLATAPTIAGGAISGLTGLAVRDTSAAFDVTIAATSSTTLTAGRTLTLDLGNVAHTLKFGTTANTITFPSVASDTVAMLGTTQTLTGVNTFSKNAHFQVVGGTGSGFWLDSVTTGADRWFFGSDAVTADVFRVFSVLLGANAMQYDAGATLFTVNGGVTASLKISSNAAVSAFAATTIPAGGTAGSGLLLSSTSNFGVFFGSGAPTLAAAKGSLYLRSDGTSTSTRSYINTDGSTTWTSLTTAA